MTTLTLTPEVEKALTMEADLRGLSVSEYAQQILEQHPVPADRLKNGQDLVAFWQSEGLIGYRSDILDSSKHARELRDRASVRIKE